MKTQQTKRRNNHCHLTLLSEIKIEAIMEIINLQKLHFNSQIVKPVDLWDQNMGRFLLKTKF